MSEIFSFEKSPLEELRDLLPGTDGFDFGASPKTIVERVAEKRRQDPLYSPSLAELKAVDAVLVAQARKAGGFDLGTRPHGLSADLPEPHQETPGASSLSLHAKPVLTLPDSACPDAARTKEHGRPADAESGFDLPPCAPRPGGFSKGDGARGGLLTSPEAYTSPKVRSDCRCIREAAAKQAREGAHYLRLDDREYLHVYAAVEHDRNRTRKAIRKGVADPQDLKATDSVWGILQAVMVRRMKGYRL